MPNEENYFENDKITGLLGSLKRVDAPGEFDFRVRARITAGRPAVRPSWLSALGKAAAMMILLAAVAGYFGFRSFRTPAVDKASVITLPAVSDGALTPKEETASNREVVPPSNEQTSDQMAVRTPETRTPPEPEVAVKEAVKRTGSNKRSTGSRVEAFSISPVITAPDRTQHLTKDVLFGFGIDANNNGSGWTVGEVKQNSRAERSGLKTGDVIQSVKNRTVRVRRDGKIVQIELKP